MNARNAVVAFTHGIRTLPVYTIVISHYITNAQIYSLDSSSVPSDRTKKAVVFNAHIKKFAYELRRFFFGRLAYTVFNFIIFIGCCSFLFLTCFDSTTFLIPCMCVCILRKRFFFLSHFYTLWWNHIHDHTNRYERMRKWFSGCNAWINGTQCIKWCDGASTKIKYKLIYYVYSAEVFFCYFGDA